MLKAEGVAFRYGDQLPWVFSGLDLTLSPGEVLGLMGTSGRGKTTLARVLAGYLPPAAGRVTLDDRPLPDHGYCPVQLIFQHPELAVNPRWRIDRVLGEAFEPSEALLDALQIDRGWLTRFPNELSGGELQRIAVARALGPGTRYLIADEMTAMLDAATQAQIWHAVREHARREQLGLLLISHDAPLVERLCDRVVMLDQDGRMVPSEWCLHARWRARRHARRLKATATHGEAGLRRLDVRLDVR
jgi:peptide/nickel transport system ATP-binding protein